MSHTKAATKYIAQASLLIFALTSLVGCGGSSGSSDLVLPQNNALISGAVTTLAGTAGMIGSVDDTGALARFNSPLGVATDGTNLYVSDSFNHTIRQIVITTGVVTTLAGTAGMIGSTDDTGALARFNLPRGIIADGVNLYVADTSNHIIRQIVIATGAVTTLAGTAGMAGSTDDTGALARFSNPIGIIADGVNLYVADTSNHIIRQIVIATGVVTTLAGTAGMIGPTDDTGALARFNFPHGITSDGTNLYVVDRDNDTIRQIVIATGVVTTLAGTAGVIGSNDGTGALAQFDGPNSLAADGANLYVTDGGNHTVRQIVIATGVVTTLAGTAGMSGSTDGTGALARFFNPTGLIINGDSLFVSERNTHTIRQID